MLKRIAPIFIIIYLLAACPAFAGTLNEITTREVENGVYVNFYVVDNSVRPTLFWQNSNLMIVMLHGCEVSDDFSVGQLVGGVGGIQVDDYWHADSTAVYIRLTPPLTPQTTAWRRNRDGSFSLVLNYRPRMSGANLGRWMSENGVTLNYESGATLKEAIESVFGQYWEIHWVNTDNDTAFAPEAWTEVWNRRVRNPDREMNPRRIIKFLLTGNGLTYRLYPEEGQLGISLTGSDYYPYP
jgi:hypothetical protein